MPAPKDPAQKEAWKQKIRETLLSKGIKPPAHSYELSRKATLGVPRSEETRAKISAALKGKPGISPSEETRKKISIRISKAMKGRKPAQITIERSAESRRGKPLKPEHRLKLASKFSGENNPAWKGGVSYGEYCPKFSFEFKNRVRAFFNFTCVECGKSEYELGYRLSVHHVFSNVKACCSDDHDPVFVTLCKSCHGKTYFGNTEPDSRYFAYVSGVLSGKCYYTREEFAEQLLKNPELLDSKNGGKCHV